MNDARDSFLEDTIPPAFGTYPKPAPYGPVTALRLYGHGLELPLPRHQDTIRIGRAQPPAVDLHLPFSGVSSWHATIHRTVNPDGTEELTIEDNDSRNGTGIAETYGDYRRLVSRSAPSIGALDSLCVAPSLTAGHRLWMGGVEALAVDQRLSVPAARTPP